MKRSSVIKLVLVGTGVAAVAAATTPARECRDPLGELVRCSSSSRSSSRFYFGGNAGASTAKATTPSTRGGFGATARSISAGG